MAKKNMNDTSVGVDDIFAKLIKEQNSVAPGAAVTGDEMFATTDTWIPTGSIIVDTIISNEMVGGWPCGRIVELYGEEAIGKSVVCFKAMANCQKMGGIPIYVDIEQAGSKSMMVACGVDLDRLIYSGLTSIEEIFEALEKNLQTIINTPKYHNKPVVIVLDSLAQLSTDTEIEAGFEANMNISLKKAMQLGKAYRKINPFLRKAKACLIAVNQLRDKPGVMYGDPSVTTSGKATRFAASVRCKLMGKTPIVVQPPHLESQYQEMLVIYEQEMENYKVNKKNGVKKPDKPKRVKGEEVIIGYDIILRTDKNKVGPPKREAEFRIIFSQGIIEEHAWLDHGVKLGLIKKEGHEFSLISIPNDFGVFKRSEWLELLADIEVREKFKTLLREKTILAPDAFGANQPSESEDIDGEELPEKFVMPLGEEE
jgi:recombination protein RecA